MAARHVSENALYLFLLLLFDFQASWSLSRQFQTKEGVQCGRRKEAKLVQRQKGESVSDTAVLLAAIIAWWYHAYGVGVSGEA